MMRICSLARSIGTCLLIASLIALSGSSKPPKITDKNVRELLERLDKATVNKDYKGIIAEFASDAEIEIIYSNDEKRITPTKKSYAARLIEPFDPINEHKRSRTDRQIHIDSNGESATAKDVIYESTIIGDQILSSRTMETTTLRIENSKVAVTSVRRIVTYKESNL
jgi:ribosome biogenesis SPOUT family RNA methylase Rps3